MINRQLATDIFTEINQHTLPGEGITRPSYSPEETQAMQVVERYAKAYGFRTSWDGVGNLHCVLDGATPEIVTGSHLDSVPHGGQYDGVAGVVAGLLAMHYMSFSSASNRQLRLIVFRGEESAWFGKCYLGSKGLFGLLTKEDLRRRSAHDGETLGRRIAHCGGFEECANNNQPGPQIDLRTIDYFIEVHIEQGPVLHNLGCPVGIVDSIVGNHRYQGAEIRGEAGHSGTTPNNCRKDEQMYFVYVKDNWRPAPALGGGPPFQAWFEWPGSYTLACTMSDRTDALEGARVALLDHARSVHEQLLVRFA